MTMYGKGAFKWGGMIRILLLVIVGFVLYHYRASFANKDLAALTILATMLALFVADMATVLFHKTNAIDYQRYSYVHLNKCICGMWRHLRRIPIATYFFIGILWKILAGIISPDLSMEGVNKNVAAGSQISFLVVVVIIIAPVFETFIFQVLPIEISNRITKKYTGKPCVLFSIAVSALLFAVEHRFSIAYMCFAFILGLYLAFFYSYTSRVYRKNWKKGFAATVLLHMIFNCLALAALLILNSLSGNQ